MTSRLLKRRQVLERVTFSSATLFRKINEGSFPAPIKIGLRSVAWVTEEIDAWERSRIAERDAGGRGRSKVSCTPHV